MVSRTGLIKFLSSLVCRKVILLRVYLQKYWESSHWKSPYSRSTSSKGASMTGSTTSLTNSTIVAIASTSPHKQEAKIFPRLTFHILTISIARLPICKKQKHLYSLILGYLLNLCQHSVDNLPLVWEFLLVFCHDIAQNHWHANLTRHHWVSHAILRSSL